MRFDVSAIDADLELSPVQWKSNNIVARLISVVQNCHH